jgi:hypothetical protein
MKNKSANRTKGQEGMRHKKNSSKKRNSRKTEQKVKKNRDTRITAGKK